MRRLFLPILLLAAPVAAQDKPGWPSADQIKLVHDRRASFPVEHGVSAVDWYQPQENVKGVARPRALPIKSAALRTIAPEAITAATAYADTQKSHALLVWRKGALEVEHYASGFGPASRYETASMHKSVVALAVGAAVAAGKIGSVDDPIDRYIPQLKAKARGALPLRAYLEMASGIETPRPGDDASVYYQYYFGDDLNTDVAHWPDTCAPRSEFCYANANTHYLGWALSNATGMRYAQWLSRAIWQPIGASDARLWLDAPGGSPRYSCCLMATARDWLRVGRLVLDRGKARGRQVVPASWIAAMTAPSPANANYGWQIWRGSPHNPSRAYGKSIRARVPAAQPFARDDVVYLDGSAGQRVYVIPSEDMVIVRIGTPSIDWDDSRLPNLLLEGLQ
jgi:CubicO group peptidase (beta-lactamase class C family)